MARNLLMIVVSASSLGLLVSGSGCAGARPVATESGPTGMLTITGQLAYRQRVALPPDTSAVVALREISAPDGPVVAEQRIELGGNQVPVPFALDVERAKLVVGKEYAVRGAFFSGARPTWVSEPVMVDVKAERVDLGVLNMTAVGAAPATFRATGNEPGWRLEIADGNMTLLTDYGQTRIVMPAPAPQTLQGKTEYAARDDRHSMTVTISDQVCADSMSGMPHPNKVVVLVDGKELNGCGGDPATLLQAVEWVVESIDGAPLLKGSKVTVLFGGDGRISGSASCNSYTGGYALTGEGLSIQQPAATMRMCEAELMNQERAFLKMLAGTKRFEIQEGALILVTADGRAIKARRG